MPRRDGTGPSGMGPLTGRGMGYCRPGKTVVYRRGYGRGCGFGYGRGVGSYGNINDYSTYQVSPEEEKSYLKDQETILKSQIEGIKKRLEELE